MGTTAGIWVLGFAHGEPRRANSWGPARSIQRTPATPSTAPASTRTPGLEGVQPMITTPCAYTLGLGGGAAQLPTCMGEGAGCRVQGLEPCHRSARAHERWQLIGAGKALKAGRRASGPCFFCQGSWSGGRNGARGSSGRPTGANGAPGRFSLVPEGLELEGLTLAGPRF
jgi:hypothetical protein